MKKQEKIKDLKKLNKDEMKRLLNEKKEKLRQFRFDLSAGKVKDVREIRETKKDIARVFTFLKQQ